ncbi:MAG: hypothetical protein HYV63_09230 [Candidatus Schekmanbacteria bacterium]|nr:hypothetical protein [Candidatus Schekmanbacteria bacterium]
MMPDESWISALAARVQDDVPFVPRPYDAIARDLGVPAQQVLGQLVEWFRGEQLREISAVLEGEALGYESALVAGTVSPARLEEVVRIVNGHPTVTHNYLRDHRYNLWFTLAVPAPMGIEASLRLLAREANVSGFFPLRRTATYKIGVRFALDSLENNTSYRALEEIRPITVTSELQAAFRALQRPLPLVERPFAALARDAGMTEDELLTVARRHHGCAIRRYVATFRHRRMGIQANGMVVWRVGDDERDATGTALAQAPQVSHCYARSAIDGFPYTLYTMLHGQTEDAVSARARELSALVGISDYAILFSRKELKKCRLRYFLPELERWWEQRAPLPAGAVE